MYVCKVSTPYVIFNVNPVIDALLLCVIAIKFGSRNYMLCKLLTYRPYSLPKRSTYHVNDYTCTHKYHSMKGFIKHISTRIHVRRSHEDTQSVIYVYVRVRVINIRVYWGVVILKSYINFCMDYCKYAHDLLCILTTVSHIHSV